MLHFPSSVEVIEVIAYSRLKARKLSDGECIALHQWANLKLKPCSLLRQKYQALVNEINRTGFKKPLIKYDESLYIVYYCNNTQRWIRFRDN